MKNRWVWPNVFGLLLVLAVNSLATILPINGQTTADVSDAYPVLFTPAGYVFSIWGLIYLLLIAFAIYQAMPQQKTNAPISAVGGFFFLSCLLNAAWIFAWHYNSIGLSVAIMVALLISLITVYLRVTGENLNGQDRRFVKLPFSVYLGWICVATIANISIALYSINWGGWGATAEAWTITMLSVGTLLAVFMALNKKDGAFALVFAWAFAGIYANQRDVRQVALAAMILAALVFTSAVVIRFTYPCSRGHYPK